jgi:hypothetical protein
MEPLWVWSEEKGIIMENPFHLLRHASPLEAEEEGKMCGDAFDHIACGESNCLFVTGEGRQ